MFFIKLIDITKCILETKIKTFKFIRSREKSTYFTSKQLKSILTY